MKYKRRRQPVKKVSKMLPKNFCCGLSSKNSVLLIAVIDTIICLILFLLSLLALSDLQRVSTYIQRDTYQIGFINTPENEQAAEKGLNQFNRMHGEVILAALGSLLSLLLASGLFVGVHKNADCLIKTWLIASATGILLGIISCFVLVILTSRLSYLALNFLILLRIYESYIVFDYLRTLTFNFPPRSSVEGTSCERLHSV